MSRAGCARFEADLADALGSSGPCAPEVAASLREHATACAPCRGSLDLVEVAAAEVRDPVPDPPPSYWARFDAELAARLGRERGRVVRRRIAAVLAASVAGAAILGAIAVRHGPFRSATLRPLPPLDEPAPDQDDAFEPFPTAGALGGFTEDDGASLFSGADDLTTEDQERLLEWLRRERERLAGGAA